MGVSVSLTNKNEKMYHIICIGFIILQYLVCLPLCIHYIRKYIKMNSILLLGKRKSRICLLGNYAYMVIIFIIIPIQYIIIVFYEKYNYGLLRQWMFFLRTILDTSFTSLRFLRNWVLWFTFHYTNVFAKKYKLTQASSKNLMNPSSNNNNIYNNSFFIKYKKCGSIKHLTIFSIIIMSGIFAMFGIILIIIDEYKTVFLCVSGLFVTIIVLFVVLAISISSVKDSLYIRTEIMVEATCLFIGAVLLGGVQLFDNASSSPLVTVIVLISPAIAYTGCIFATTALPLKLLKPKLANERVSMKNNRRLSFNNWQIKNNAMTSISHQDLKEYKTHEQNDSSHDFNAQVIFAKQLTLTKLNNANTVSNDSQNIDEIHRSTEVLTLTEIMLNKKG